MKTTKYTTLAALLMGLMAAGGCEGEPGRTGGPLGSAGESCATDSDCEPGLECEIEHGESFCKPHGGDDGSRDDGSGDDGLAGDAGAPPSGSCASDADCGPGLECEIEHGTSYCKPHGGD